MQQNKDTVENWKRVVKPKILRLAPAGNPPYQLFSILLYLLPMELLYAKYNRHRLAPFQIETSVWRDRHRKIVLKKALGPEAVPHLRRLHAQAAPVRASLRGDRLRLPGVAVLDERTLQFDFIEGVSLDALLAGAFRDQDQTRFLGIIADYGELLQSAFTAVSEPVLTEDMRQVFGLAAPADLDGLGPFLTPALADPVLENIIVDGDRRFCLIDNEWVFEGCLPVSFVLFRSLFYFYEKNKAFGLEAWMPLPAVLERFALAPETIRRYRAMDEAFQAYVFGRERCFRYKDRYAKSAQSLPSLQNTIDRLAQYLRECHAENERISRLLREGHAENERLCLIITRIYKSRGWRFVQKAGRLLDARFPPNTLRRRVLERLLRSFQ